jgi:DNA-binding transcriptional LysR family regulator
MRLEIRHVRTVLAVVEERSLTRAAKRLGVPQPSLSSQVRRIEKTLNTELFRRTSRGVTLTKGGERLLPHFLAVEDEMRALERDAQVTPPLSSGPVRVGVEYQALLDALEERCGRRRLPLQLGLTGPPVTKPALLDGAFDFVQTSELADDPLPRPFRAGTILEEEVGLLVPPDHPYSSRKWIRLADLAEQEWVSFLPHTAWHEELLRACSAAGFSPRVRYVATSEAALEEVAIRAGAVALGTAALAAGGRFHLRSLDHRSTRRMVGCWNSVTTSESLAEDIFLRIRRWYEQMSHDLAASA